MNATELMINDWVGISPSEDKPSYLGQVRRICQSVISLKLKPTDETPHEYVVPYNEIEPVPLTDAILKINDGVVLYNCEYDDGGNEYHTYAIENSRIAIRYIGERQWQIGCICKEYENDECDEEEFWYYNIIIEYVHELQHALRLCGLNELADNWRVE